MNNPETTPYNLGQPVPYTRPGPLAVGLSHVLLFLLMISPVFGVVLGGWALHEIGHCVGHGMREWRQELRERREIERRDDPAVWRAPGTAERPAGRFAEEPTHAEF